MKVVRTILSLMLTAAAIWVFIAGAKTGSAPLPPGFVKIQYWEKWTGQEAQQMKMIVDQFNKTVGKDEHIFVEYTSLSNVDQKTLVATAAGVPPDVAGLWAAQLVQFSAMDALEPLEDMAAAHGIVDGYYKPIYWKSCHYRGHLFGLISTPCAIVLHYNKQIFQDHAAELRAKGLDPDRAPRTIDELDRYADVLTTYETINGNKHIKTFGQLPLEPGWYIPNFPSWFGGSAYDAKRDVIDLNAPPVVAAFEWIAGYSRRYGKDSITEFRSGLGGYNSPQNAFLTGAVAMEQQGPWMANTIEDLCPRMNRWHVPAECLKREQNYKKLRPGMSFDEVQALLGGPTRAPRPTLFENVTWDAAIRTITVHFENNKLVTKAMTYTPAEQRRQYVQWAAAPFPSADPKVKLTGFCDYDSLVIPRGSKHKKEAFEFIAFVNRQDVMESLCSMHTKNSPLAKVTKQFIDYHPNPYIQVFEDCANSPDAFAPPQTPIWPEVSEELIVTSQKVYLQAQTPAEALNVAQRRCQEKLDYFKMVQAKRSASASAAQ